MLHFHIKPELTRPIETIEIRYNDDDILNYDCILSTSALCYYISKMNKQAKLYIRTNNDLGQCLHHSIATQYINQVEICQAAENKLGETKQTKQQFEFKNGKVYFTETPKIISSQHYNPEEFRFKIYTNFFMADLIITYQNNINNYDKINFEQADFGVTDVKFDFDDFDEIDESTKQEQEKNTKKIWDEIDIKMNRARGTRVITAWSVFEDFFKKIFGVSLIGEDFKDIGYCLKKKDTECYIPFNSADFMNNAETQLVNIIQKIKEGNTSSFGASPKSTLLPIIHNDSTPKIPKLFSIAMAWYCNILPDVLNINTEQFCPISFEYTRPATVFSIENILDSIDFPEILQSDTNSIITILYYKGGEEIDRNDQDNELGVVINNRYIYLMFLISQFFNTRGNWIEKDVKEFLKNLMEYNPIKDNRECKAILKNLLHTLF